MSIRCSGRHAHAGSGEVFHWDCTYVHDRFRDNISFGLTINRRGSGLLKLHGSTTFRSAGGILEEALVVEIRRLIDGM